MDDEKPLRELPAVIFITLVLGIILSTIAVRAPNRYVGPVDAGQTAASPFGNQLSR